MSQDALVDALYARVIRRVCERFIQQRDGNADTHSDSERLALMEQQWRERLSRYTGRTLGHEAATLAALEGHGEIEDPGADDKEAEDEQSEAVVEIPREPTHCPTRMVAMGRPASVYTETAPQPSIFARMMREKRKLDQLDGETEDTSSCLDPPIPPPQPSDIAPVSTLSISRFPLQCSARDVSFGYKKNTLRGRWKSIVMTLLRRVRANEMLAVGQFLWLVSESVGGMVVEVVNVSTGERSMVEVRGENQTETRHVDRNDLRRFFECVVCKGYSRFECLYQ